MRSLPNPFEIGEEVVLKKTISIASSNVRTPKGNRGKSDKTLNKGQSFKILNFGVANGLATHGNEYATISDGSYQYVVDIHDLMGRVIAVGYVFHIEEVGRLAMYHYETDKFIGHFSYDEKLDGHDLYEFCEKVVFDTQRNHVEEV